MKQARRHNDHGFTLTEMLVTVTIVIVLFALAMIPISKMRREVRQTELDSRAELIFMAAQNQLTQLQAAGRTSAYQGGLALGYVPEDAENENGKYDADTLSYVTSDGMASATSPAANILPEGKVDAELRNAHWVIEYDASSASVYAVFYSEQESNFYTAAADKMDPLRARNYRLQQGAKIGYYGGDSVLSYDTSELDAKAEIVNGDQLLLKITCNRLLGESGFLDPTFTVTLRDESGHTAEVTLANNEIVKDTRSIEATLVLDNLAEGDQMRFAEQERFKSLVPGENLTISVNVSVDNDLVEPAVIENIRTNSLFADARDGSNGRTAVITCGRHLQNLDKDSGLNSQTVQNRVITAAVQEQDVEFKTEAEDGWKVLYNDMTFKPIENENLTSYDSTYQSMSNAAAYHPVIYDLTAAVESGDAGLFAAFKGDLKNIRLAGATITGSGNVGGLVGKLNGRTTIEGCWVYLSSARNHAADKTEKDLWLDGAVTGGLVGNAGSGKLTIENSFAATVLNGTKAAGGLIGSSSVSTEITHSYADCYVYAVTTENGKATNADTANGMAGGLIGSRRATSTVNISDCYAAGFLKAETTAGIVAGELAGSLNRLTNVYTACAPLDGTSLSYIIGKKEGVDPPGVHNVFYLSDVESDSAYSGLQQVSYAEWSGSKIPDASVRLSDGTATAFTAATSTTPYNLMEGLGLTRYSYPALTDLPHYGDWQAQFENESLAYYEKYTDGSYGFSGGNISTLKTDGTVAVGDGYGLLYETKPAADVKVTVGGKTYTLDHNNPIEVTAANKGETKTYYLLPLPADLVQEMGVGDSFYTKLTVAEGGKTFYYNPHFANTTAPGTDSDIPDTPERVEVRTARQLNALSAYYDEYVKDDNLLAGNTAFVQGTNIDYSRYDWTSFGKDGGKSVSEQTPIGASAAQPFRYSYNGSSYQITGVSFTGETCVGLFGYNTGTLSNIIITTDEPMNNADGSVNSNAPTAKVTSTVQLNTVYVGVLAGWNQTGGVISNCAVSGYNLTGYAYSGSTSYVGGLVGFNAGAIRAGSAVTPLIKGTGNLVQSLSIGGLVGGNGGQIRQSYALAAINVMEVSGNVTIAGFAGGNVGTIRDSYCATAMTSAGAATYGFAPASGSLNNCCFLTGGTYTFAGKVYLYDYTDVTVSGATGLSSKELAELSLDGFGAIADAAHSVNHPNTAIDETEEAVYPYPGSVTGRDGARTHYGDWVTDADLGTLGVIYWEKEEGGSNDGYHFSFIGFEDGVQQKADSSLCEAHDDGGKITDYGYGYYWKDTENEPEPKLEAALSPLNNVHDSGTFALGEKSTGDTAGSAAAELEKQVPGYNFVTYQTGEGADRMRLLSSKTANGQWTLTQEDQSGTKLTFRFLLNPFFANSYSYVDEKAETPGTEELAYQVRSVEQLQFINWSYSNGKGSTTADVTSTNYKTFPYLQYATVTQSGSQTKEDSLRGNDGGPRPIQTWKQTHDVNGTDLSAPTDGKKNAAIHPIAGAVNYSEKKTGGQGEDNYELILYNWFGGQYDGRNYYIKNIRIESYCYNVGLFGTTVGAEIGNIVLYSDNDSIIQRSSKPTPHPYSNGRSDPATYQTSYALGGLVGIAYDYASNNTSEAKSTINNCAIAGYSIQDNSKNKLRLGEAVVGGLIGVSNVDLQNCSAVADIQINCTHRWGAVSDGGTSRVKDGLNAACWGNFIRVGGLVGGLRDTATNCYTGGSISVSGETLKERIPVDDDTNTKFCDGKVATQVKWSNSKWNGNADDDIPGTYVYVGGVGGSGFSANFTNFTGQATDPSDGKPKFVNCYTYVKFPTMEGTIMAVSIIGGAADRQNYVQATITNCYYLSSITEGVVDTNKVSKCYNSNRWSDYYSLASIMGRNGYAEAMLKGDMRYLKDFFTNANDAKSSSLNGLTGLTYAQMSDQTGSTGSITTQNTNNNRPQSYTTFKDALNQGAQGPFDWVSVEENNASIHGKYSFPGSDSELRGQDYPFPTVLTQTDIFGDTVHLHYGRWPKVGMFWKDGITTLDLIADYVQAAGKSQIETQLVLNNTGLTLDANDAENVTFTYGNGATESDVASASVKSVVSETTPAFNVVLEGKAPGAVEVTATFMKNGTTYTARLTLTVTAELNVTLTPAIVDEYVGDETDVKLQALNSRNEPVTSNIVWALVSDDEKIAAASSVGTGSTTKIKGVSEGETSIHVTATVTLGGKTYTGTNVLGVTVSQQGVLGIANTASAEPQYVEGKLARDLKGWYKENATSAGGPANKTYPDNDGTAAPVCESTLFLYGRGQKAKLSSFDVTGITVTAKETTATGGTKEEIYNVLTDQSKYTVTVGTVSENGKDTVLPLTVRGRQQGEITLTVKLTDRRAEAESAAYELSIPYTLTEADTQVTATFAGLNGEPIGTQTVNYGGRANAPTISEDLLAELEKALPEGSDLSDADSWEPSLTSPLYIDTVFRPKYEAGTASADDE